MSSGSSAGDKFAYKSPVKVSKSVVKQANVSVCHVQAPPIPPNTVGLQGSATLYELAEGVFTAATNNRVLPITDTDFLVRVVFTFEGVGAIRLSRDEIKFCTTNEELDATVIELTEQCAKRLQQLGAKFIRVTTASNDKGELIHRGTTSLLAITVSHLSKVNILNRAITSTLNVSKNSIMLYNTLCCGY